MQAGVLLKEKLNGFIKLSAGGHYAPQFGLLAKQPFSVRFNFHTYSLL
jgi:hypothetical protein